MTQNRQISSIQETHSLWRRAGKIRGPHVGVLLLAALLLSACLSLLAPTGPARTPVVLPVASGDRPQIAISPPSGYAGVYVQVVGNGWPANDLVLVTLSDDAGRSGILAASAANSSGQVTTGFLYPISPRWLSPGAHTIVAYTANGNLQASAEFQVVTGEGVTPVSTKPVASPTATATGLRIQTPTPTPTTASQATATPSPTATPAPPTPIVISDWKGEYWANSTLSGEPDLVRNDTALFFDWGSGAPAPNLPADQFSARWSRQLDFDAGIYQFFVEIDDGARVYVDDQLVLDEWQAGSQRMAAATVPLAAGRHTLRVDYFERTGQALARFWWERQVSFTGWEGRYYNNPNLQGDPGVVRDDAAINFDWSDGSPAAGIGADNFSVRWKRTIAFSPGRYRFYARMDDGLRVRIDGQILVDEWRDGSERTVATDVELPGGNYQIEVEYYERSGGALVSFWWELTPQPTPTHTPSWTPTSIPTEVPTSTPTDVPTQTPTPTPEDTATPTAEATATPTETPTAQPSETATVVASGGTPGVELPEEPEIGHPLAFTSLLLPSLLPPKVALYQMITSDAGWSALLESLRPPKSARPALRPTATPTPTVTPAGGGPIRLPGGLPVSPAVLLPDFAEEIVLVAILAGDQPGETVKIVDVRLEATDLYIKVRIQPQTSRLLPLEARSDAVTVRRELLPPLSSLHLHFVDEAYQLLPLSGGNR